MARSLFSTETFLKLSLDTGEHTGGSTVKMKLIIGILLDERRCAPVISDPADASYAFSLVEA
jgi:hypothetical protein